VQISARLRDLEILLGFCQSRRRTQCCITEPPYCGHPSSQLRTSWQAQPLPDHSTTYCPPQMCSVPPKHDQRHNQLRPRQNAPLIMRGMMPGSGSDGLTFGLARTKIPPPGEWGCAKPQHGISGPNLRQGLLPPTSHLCPRCAPLQNGTTQTPGPQNSASPFIFGI